MRRQVVIHNTFARSLDQKFRKGQKVYYTKNYGNGPEYPAVIEGVGKRDGDIVYDVRLDYAGAVSDLSWGYEDQFRARDAKDTVGSQEEIAYGEGYHSQRSDESPYMSAELKAAWERGRKAAKIQGKATSNYFKGEIRKTRFERPALRDSKDFNSERGFIAKVFSANGRVVAQSEPFLSDSPAEDWLRKQIDKAARLGYHVTGKVFNGYFDPAQLA